MRFFNEFIKINMANKYGKEIKYNEEFMPLGILRPTTEIDNGIYSIKLDKEESLVERIIQLDITRPSTLLYHSKKINDRFIDCNQELNLRGISAIVENFKNNNLMMNLEISKEIEEKLHTPHNEQDSEKIIRDSLKMSGFITKIKHVERKLDLKKHKTHKISWGGIEI